MSNELDRAANALFPSTGNSQVGNVKFFRGRRREITAEQMAEQLNRADAQIRAGECKPNTNIDGDLTA
jgi:hypothetical protein